MGHRFSAISYHCRLLDKDIASNLANSLPDSENWIKAVSRASSELRSAYDSVLNLGINKFEDLRRNNDWFRSINAAGSPVLSMLANGLIDSAASGGLTPALVEGFGADLLDHIARAEVAESEEEVASLLQALLAWLMTQAKRLPGTIGVSEALLAIFLTIATLLYEHYSDKQTEKNLKEKIEQEADESEKRVLRSVQEAEGRIVEELRSRRSQSSAGNVYVVVKAAQLRQGPGTDFDSLRVLPPNLIVEETAREGEWLKVEFFDYVEGEPQQGWIAIELLMERPVDQESVQAS